MTVGRKDLAGQFLKHAAHLSGGLGKIKVKFRDLMEIAAVFKNALEHESNVLNKNRVGEALLPIVKDGRQHNLNCYSGGAVSRLGG